MTVPLETVAGLKLGVPTEVDDAGGQRVIVTRSEAGWTTEYPGAVAAGPDPLEALTARVEALEQTAAIKPALGPAQPLTEP